MRPGRLSVLELQRRKERGERWAMLTSYDQLTAGIFEAAGVDVLLVGDSAANNVLGYPDTVSVTVDEMLPAGPSSGAWHRTRAGRRRPPVRVVSSRRRNRRSRRRCAS